MVLITNQYQEKTVLNESLPKKKLPRAIHIKTFIFLSSLFMWKTFQILAITIQVLPEKIESLKIHKSAGKMWFCKKKKTFLLFNNFILLYNLYSHKKTRFFENTFGPHYKAASFHNTRFMTSAGTFYPPISNFTMSSSFCGHSKETCSKRCVSVLYSNFNRFYAIILDYVIVQTQNSSSKCPMKCISQIFGTRIDDNFSGQTYRFLQISWSPIQ